MRDIVPKVTATAPKTKPLKSVKTKYKNFEDYAKLHRTPSSNNNNSTSTEESETCSATSYVLKSKYLDNYRGRSESIKDDQESVGSDDSGLGSISEVKSSQYASYNDFLNTYKKNTEPMDKQTSKKVVRSEIFIQVGNNERKVDNVHEFVVKPVGGVTVDGIQRQSSLRNSEGEGSAKLNLSRMQNFNRVPKKFEPSTYPKPDVASSIVKPVAGPALSPEYKPVPPPIPDYIKNATRPVAAAKPSASVINGVAEPKSNVCNRTPTQEVVADDSAKVANPMQRVFEEIRKRSGNVDNNVAVPTAPAAAAPPPPPLPTHSVLHEVQTSRKDECTSIIPPPPPLCDFNKHKPQHFPPPPPPMQTEQQRSAQFVEKERQHSIQKAAPPPLQQELFKKLSEMNKKMNHHEPSSPPAAPAHPPKTTSDAAPPKYNTLPRFHDVEKESMANEKTVVTAPYAAATLDRKDQKKKIVYNVYRDMLGSYNAKANNIVSALPTRMVREDQGVKKQLESLLQQVGSMDHITGRMAPKTNQEEE